LKVEIRPNRIHKQEFTVSKYDYTRLHRRDFAKHTAAGMAGLVAGGMLSDGVLTSQRTSAQETETSDKRLVQLGLNALARAHEKNYFVDGHKGASLVSAHLLCVDNGLDATVRGRISELFELNWASTPLCSPFPASQPDPEQISKIGVTLMEGGEVLRQVGHNAIFAMQAIKAFRLMPEAATPERIEGVCKLIQRMTPWRDVEPDAAVDPPPFSDSVAASRYILREASTAVDRFIGFGQGFAGHMLTFGQSLVELASMGDVEWAESCRTAFRKYVTVTRLGPDPSDRRIADHKPTELRPSKAEYWQKRGDRTLGIGHVFKYPYSYYDLLRRANDPELQAEWEAKAYHLF
jgi:hypothetical protein